MTYGSISDEMRGWIEKRAAEGNVLERFTLEPSLCENGYEGTCNLECDCFVEGISYISIIVEGALDEEFPVKANGYEVNIADWIAEKLEHTGVKDFWVLVSNDEGDMVYSTETGL